MTVVQRQATRCYGEIDQLTFWCATMQLYFVESNDLFYFEVDL